MTPCNEEDPPEERFGYRNHCWFCLETDNCKCKCHSDCKRKYGESYLIVPDDNPIEWTLNGQTVNVDYVIVVFKEYVYGIPPNIKYYCRWLGKYDGEGGAPIGILKRLQRCDEYGNIIPGETGVWTLTGVDLQ